MRTTLVRLLGMLIAGLLVAWVLMLALGILHHDVADEVPALGYLSITAILLAVRSVLAFVAYPFRKAESA